MPFLLVIALAASVEGLVQHDTIALPGCTVMLSSDSVRRSVITDVNGAYRIDDVLPGRYDLAFELHGLEKITRTIVLAEGENVQKVADLRAVLTETITLSCRPCSIDAPETPWQYPTCADFELDDLAIKALKRGDPSAVSMARQRHAVAFTHTQKQSLAGALLRRAPDDSAYWNELFADARNAVRFARVKNEYSAEYEEWCAARALNPDDYHSLALRALDEVAGDSRARPLLEAALRTNDVDVVAIAILGFGTQRDESALPAIAEALKHFPDENGGYLTYGLSLFASPAADAVALQYLEEDEREDYLELRTQQPEE
ncbi:MAG TPA: carboxypeptidase-like regulatory domain-containing protein [Thermoanaerobaculia bacterium]|jgi:hypothetical protein